MKLTIVNAVGYTLYEMMVVLAIVGVMSSIAFPLVCEEALSHNNQNTFLQLKAVIKIAQEEAIRRGSKQVIICAAKFNVNGVLYNDNCNANDGIWSGGAIDFIDLNSDGIYNGSGSEERINAIRFDYGVIISSVVNRLQVNSDGVLSDTSGRLEWQFRLSQTKFGVTYCRTTVLNHYGYFTQLMNDC